MNLSDEHKKQLTGLVLALAGALIGGLTSLLGTCNAGIVTKGDLAESTKELKSEIGKCVQRAEMGPAPEADEDSPKPKPVYRRLLLLEQQTTALAARDAMETSERAALTVAGWRTLQNRQAREAWKGARNAALDKWEVVALGKPPAVAAKQILSEAGVQR